MGADLYKGMFIVNDFVWVGTDSGDLDVEERGDCGDLAVTGDLLDLGLLGRRLKTLRVRFCGGSGYSIVCDGTTFLYGAEFVLGSELMLEFGPNDGKSRSKRGWPVFISKWMSNDDVDFDIDRSCASPLILV